MKNSRIFEHEEILAQRMKESVRGIKVNLWPPRTRVGSSPLSQHSSRPLESEQKIILVNAIETSLCSADGLQRFPE